MLFKGKKLVFVFTVLVLSIICMSQTAEARDYGSAENDFYLTDLQKSFVDRWWPTIKSICTEFQTDSKGPSEHLVLTTFGLESFYGTSDIFQDKNNGFGIDAYPTETKGVYENARWFDSAEDSIREYCRIIVDGYPTAVKSYRDPYTAIKSIAPSYAPGSDNYIEDIQSMLDRISLYVMSKYMESITEAEGHYSYALQVLADTKQKYTEYLKARQETSNIEKLGNRYRRLGEEESIIGIDFEALKFERTIATIEENLMSRGAELEAAIARAQSTIHVLALGVEYGRFDTDEARHRMFGDAHGLIMAEYERLNA